jgi:hypothetical protein
MVRIAHTSLRHPDRIAKRGQCYRGCRSNDANVHKAACRRIQHPALHPAWSPRVVVVVVSTEPAAAVAVARALAVAAAAVAAVAAVAEAEAHCYLVRGLWKLLVRAGQSCFRKHGCWTDQRDEERSKRRSTPLVAIRSLLELYASTQRRAADG